MIMYAILSIPLSFLLFMSLKHVISLADGKTWKTFFFGVILATPSFLIVHNIRRPLPAELTMQRIFFHVLFYEHLFLLLFPLGLYFLFYIARRGYTRHETDSGEKALIFFSGFYSILIISDVLIWSELRDLYVLFLQPSLRIASVLVIVVGIVIFDQNFGWKRYAGLGAIFGYMAAAAAVTMLYWSGFIFIAILGTTVLLGLMVFTYLKTHE